MCLFAAGHTVFHFFNYWYRSEATLATFSKWGWGGTAFFTGSLICFAMFFIFTAASDTVRYAHYEIFFSAHHWFVVYFICLLMHGPIYWKWAAVPLCLYLWERVMQETRGDRPYYVNKVEVRERGWEPSEERSDVRRAKRAAKKTRLLRFS